MGRVRLGILSPANIARTRFLPSLLRNDLFEYVGVAHASREERFGDSDSINGVMNRSTEKTNYIQSKFGGVVFDSYINLLRSDDVDAIYIPLPPALHFEWAKKASFFNKHIFLEKPSTTSLANTKILADEALERDVAVCENYMFMFHTQLKSINEHVMNKAIGELRLVRSSFTFPFRGNSDFRYTKELGGGALLDCGGYPLKIASFFLGEDAKVYDSSLTFDRRFGVDIGGNIVLRNSSGLTAQIAFGMDNQYTCSLELLGTTGKIIADRIFTSPPDIEAEFSIIRGNDLDVIKTQKFDQFDASLKDFAKCIKDQHHRKQRIFEMVKQSSLVEEAKKMALIYYL